MAFALGSALMARDIAGERRDLEEQEADLQKEMEKQAEQQQKKGMWGSIGRTLGTAAVGAALTPFMGPGALLAAKMAGGYLGGRLGQGAIKTSKAGLKIDSKGKFLGEERRALGRSAEQAREDFSKATKGMKKQLIFSSVANPLMSLGAAKGLKGLKALGGEGAFDIGKTAGEGWAATGDPILQGSGTFSPFDPATGLRQEYMGQVFDPATGIPAREMQYTGGNIWDRLTDLPEISTFLNSKGE